MTDLLRGIDSWIFSSVSIWVNIIGYILTVCTTVMLGIRESPHIVHDDGAMATHILFGMLLSLLWFIVLPMELVFIGMDYSIRGIKKALGKD